MARVEDEPAPTTMALKVFVDASGILRHVVYARHNPSCSRSLSMPSLCEEGEEFLDDLHQLALSQNQDADGNHILFDGDPFAYQTFLDRYSRQGQTINFFRAGSKALNHSLLPRTD